MGTTINKIACVTNGRKLNSASYTLFKTGTTAPPRLEGCPAALPCGLAFTLAPCPYRLVLPM
ncbi:hypothetical protein E2C01_088367 [Portunus trituberculatus]|uniref:Uncharacterized protein n=1 Tax=Portunus trituberculatus TaxID=210409 RepID=A0A5B7JLQ1_PORTR|nr:hypothetical protein [Portunus trituberculatus]